MKLGVYVVVVLFLLSVKAEEAPWRCHVVDNTSRGADGVRLADVNGDGLTDITTGWEEGGLTRVYLHPGYSRVKEAWPSVTVGETRSVEDAVFCDLDGDGAVDVVSCCEGKTRSVNVHWAPRDSADYMTAGSWTMESFPAVKDRSMWMYALPMQIDGKGGVDLFIGSKGSGAMVGWLESPDNPRDLKSWKFHKLYDAGWIMSLVGADIDDDGDQDLLISDRKGKTTGVLWLENPGLDKEGSVWAEHRVGCGGREVMFLDYADVDGDGGKEVAVAVVNSDICLFAPGADPRKTWSEQVVKVSYASGLGRAKAVRVGDVDGDGVMDLVYSCGLAKPPKRGLVWLRKESGRWTTRELSGPTGIKFDDIRLVDMDGDGDQDVLTCEERHENRGLGVIWYENPGSRK